MSRPQTPPILARLRAASSPIVQAAVLRDLKGEIIGTAQKKEAAIRLGIVPHLARILSSNLRRKGSSLDRDGDRLDASASRHDAEEARLQATIVVGSLAHGESTWEIDEPGRVPA